MPPRQVYGKQARAVYDPFAIFDSLQQKSSPEVKVAEVTEELSRLNVNDGRSSENRADRSTVLGELNHNATALPARQVEEKKRLRKPRRKMMFKGDKDETVRDELDQNERGIPDDLAELRIGFSEDVDNVPLFYDVHDYDTEDEAIVVRCPEQAQVPGSCENTRLSRRRILQHEAGGTTPLSTPSILDTYTQHCAELLQLSSHDLISFSQWAALLSDHFNITKIAEASFGEVYRLSLRERLSGFSSNDESVFKIIALRPPAGTRPLVKRKRQTVSKKTAYMSSPSDVANEIRLLQRMSTIPGFTNFRDVRVVQGRPPVMFQKAYRSFNDAQRGRKKDPSHFPDPTKKISYSDDQLWAVMEMQDAGVDLERLVEGGDSTSMFFSWDVFWQVTLSLAKGEEGAEFEHRDLHLGNICVRQNPVPSGGGVPDAKRKLDFTGLETTIIDYTISRAIMSDEKSIAYQDLAADTVLFEGDSTEEYQYDIYRYMRGVVLNNDPYADPPDQSTPSHDSSWEQYQPITNLIWLHYILYKLLDQVDWPSSAKAPARKLKEEHAKWKRANDLERVLLKVQDLLDPGVLCERSELKSAGDLVRLALQEGWLDVEDVVGAESSLDEHDLVAELEELTLDTIIVAQPTVRPVGAESSARRQM